MPVMRDGREPGPAEAAETAEAAEAAETAEAAEADRGPGAGLLALMAVMARLRRECPWDAQQTHESLAPHLLEESYEAIDALEPGVPGAAREDLGDVLLQ